jgi:mannose-1-phosphate guanylyltransferase
MVLAAGRGERMRPLSDVLPKPALPLPDGPLVGWAARLARDAGAGRVVVNTWHLAERLEATLLQLELGGVDVVQSPEEHLMGGAGGLALARDRGLLQGEKPVLVVNGDCVSQLDLTSLVNHHVASEELVTLALLPHLDPTRWSRVILDRQSRVERIAAPGVPDRGEVPLLYPGVMLVSAEALAALPSAEGEVDRELWQPALAAGRLGGVVVSGHWREVGTPSAYLEAVLLCLEGRSYLHPEAWVADGASLIRAMIGRGVRVEDGAEVEDSVVAEGAVVGRGARVQRSVLLGRVEVAPGAEVADRFLGLPVD